MKPVEIADGVFFVHSEMVNWVLLTDGDAVTVIDTGYPGQRGDVEESIRAIGRDPHGIEAVLITHAHVDHVGSAQYLAETYGAPVLVHPAEAAHARRECHEVATPWDVLSNIWRPGVLPWAIKLIRLGGTAKYGIDSPTPMPVPGALPCPGAPVPVLVPGHTSGHTVYHLPDRGVVISGDALITGHLTSPISGPQLLPQWFDHDRGVTAHHRRVGRRHSSARTRADPSRLRRRSGRNRTRTRRRRAVSFRRADARPPFPQGLRARYPHRGTSPSGRTALIASNADNACNREVLGGRVLSVWSSSAEAHQSFRAETHTCTAQSFDENVAERGGRGEDTCLVGEPAPVVVVVV